jgi:hypothetical protein
MILLQSSGILEDADDKKAGAIGGLSGLLEDQIKDDRNDQHY